jgi:hypothetical protein
MQKSTDPKKQKCKNCEGKGTLEKGIRSFAVKVRWVRHEA